MRIITPTFQHNYCNYCSLIEAILLVFMVNSQIWDSVEPHWDDGKATYGACYSKQLKVDLLTGTFILVSPDMLTTGSSNNNVQHGCPVARIVGIVDESSSMLP
jgi:hypothetical protein